MSTHTTDITKLGALAAPLLVDVVVAVHGSTVRPGTAAMPVPAPRTH